MGKSKRVNPRRRPATQADVEKAKRDAQTEAVCMAWAIIFTALRDKEGWGRSGFGGFGTRSSTCPSPSMQVMSMSAI